MTNDPKIKMVRIAKAAKNHTTEWWENAQGRQYDNPIIPMFLSGEQKEIRVLEHEAVFLYKTWKSIDGWKSGPRYSPLPVNFLFSCEFESMLFWIAADTDDIPEEDKAIMITRLKSQQEYMNGLACPNCGNKDGFVNKKETFFRTGHNYHSDLKNTECFIKEVCCSKCGFEGEAQMMECGGYMQIVPFVSDDDDCFIYGGD